MSKSTKIILIVLLVLAGIYALQQITSHTSTTESRKLFASIDTSKVDSILINQENVISLARTAVGWKISRPVDYPADAGAVNLLLSKFNSSIKGIVVAEHLSDTTAYGLGGKAVTLSLAGKSGKIIEMLVGNATPDFSGCYVKVKGYPQVFEIPENLRSAILRTVNEWRSKQIFSFSFSDIKAGNFSIGDTLYQFVRIDTTWQLNKRKVSNEVVEGIFTELIGLSAIDFVDSLTGIDHKPSIEYSIALNNNANVSGEIFRTSTNTCLTSSASRTTFVISPSFIDSFKNELIKASQEEQD